MVTAHEGEKHYNRVQNGYHLIELLEILIIGGLCVVGNFDHSDSEKLASLDVAHEYIEYVESKVVPWGGVQTP